MIRESVLFLCAATGGLCLAGGTASNSVDLQLHVGHDALWRTATNATFETRWRLSDGATSATLAVTGMSFAVEYPGLVQPSKVISVPVPSSPETEDVLNLTLSFDNGETRRASVAVVRGHACAGSASAGWVRFNGRAWARAARHNVLPVPAGTATLSIDDVACSTGLDGEAGWYGWSPVEKDRPYALSDVGDGFSWSAVVSWQDMPGAMLIFR